MEDESNNCHCLRQDIRHTSNMFSALLWDNDGTLVDTEPLYVEAMQASLATVDIPFTEQDYVHHMNVGGDFFEAAVQRGYAPKDIAGLKLKRNAFYTSLLRDNVPIIDGVIETLNVLFGKFRMGIVSSSRREHLDIIMERTGLRKYFEFVIAREDFVKGKPHPEAFLLGLSTFDLPASSCLAIEDSGRGVISAKTAGLACVAIPQGISKNNDFSGADKVLNNVRELPGFLGLS